MRYILLCFIFCWACQSNESANVVEETTKIERKDLIGVWEQIGLKISYNKGLNIPDSLQVFEVKEEEWIDVLSVKPIRAYFFVDSTYRQDFTDLNDNIYDSQRGLWNLIGDTLILISPQATYTYEISMENYGISEFTGIVDWDGDGMEDDEYQAKHRLISRDTRK